jgi:translin
MSELRSIGDQALRHLEEKNAARDRALQTSRTLIRHCAHAIRAVHRSERTQAEEHLVEARQLAAMLRDELGPYPDLLYAGYAQDGFKELAEAHLVAALVAGEPYPDPQTLGVEPAVYLAGLGEAAGELRRRTLDVLRRDDMAEAERLLAVMDDIYDLLVTVDYPDAITGGLRRITDMVRGVVERTRGDLTTTHQQQTLKAALRDVQDRLGRA